MVLAKVIFSDFCEHTYTHAHTHRHTDTQYNYNTLLLMLHSDGNNTHI